MPDNVIRFRHDPSVPPIERLVRGDTHFTNLGLAARSDGAADDILRSFLVCRNG